MYYNVILDGGVVRSRCRYGTALRWARNFAVSVSGMKIVKVVDENGHKVYCNV